MPSPICATLSGMLEGNTFEGALEKIEFENIIDKATSHTQKSSPVSAATNKQLAFDTAAVLGEAGNVQKLFLLVASGPLDIQINGGAVEQYRVQKPVVILSRTDPEVTTVQLIGVSGTPKVRVHMTKIVGTP